MMRWLTIVTAVSLFPFTSSANISYICSIVNPYCSCVSTAAAASSTSIRCTFNASGSISPLFTDSFFASSVTLDTLDISENSLTSLPDNFFNNEMIETLILRNNSFTVVPACVTKVKTLRSLDLSFNELISLSVDVLGALPGLQRLDLSSNQLTSLDPVDSDDKHIALLKDLTELNLTRNTIKRISDSAFNSMISLTTLTLSHNQLTEITKTTFSPLGQRLLTLDLSHNGLRFLDSQAFRSLHLVRTMNLAGSDLDSVISSLQFPQHLASLDLRDCGLTSVSHCSFSHLTDLTSLDLRDNPLNCTCELFFLHQWYQSQGSDENQWTCLKTSWSVADGTGGASGLTNSSDLREHCQDAYSLCPSTLKIISQIETTLDVELSGDRLDISWTLDIQDDLNIDGLRVRYIPEDKNSITSGVLPSEKRTLSVDTEGLVKHYMVCLDVLMYTTAIVHQNCKSFQDNTGSMVVGILAGVVFLAPCCLVLAYVFIKDYHLNKALYKQIYEEGVEDEEDVEKQQAGKADGLGVRSEADRRNPCAGLQKNEAKLAVSSKDGEAKFVDVAGSSTAVTEEVHKTEAFEANNDGGKFAEECTADHDLPAHDDVVMMSAEKSSPISAQTEGIQNLGFTYHSHHPDDETRSDSEYESTHL